MHSSGSSFTELTMQNINSDHYQKFRSYVLRRLRQLSALYQEGKQSGRRFAFYDYLHAVFKWRMELKREKATAAAVKIIVRFLGLEPPKNTHVFRILIDA